MTELRHDAKRRSDFLARGLRRWDGDRVKGEEKCQDAARLSLGSA
jgi:hypothetical protein